MEEEEGGEERRALRLLLGGRTAAPAVSCAAWSWRTCSASAQPDFAPSRRKSNQIPHGSLKRGRLRCGLPLASLRSPSPKEGLL